MDNQTPTPSNPPIKNSVNKQIMLLSKSFLSKKIILIVIILVILLSTGAMYITVNIKPKPIPQLTQGSNQSLLKPSAPAKLSPSLRPLPCPILNLARSQDETAQWQLYTDPVYKFSFKKPSGYSFQTENWSINTPGLPEPPSASLLSSIWFQTNNPDIGGGGPTSTINILTFDSDALSLNDWFKRHATIQNLPDNGNYGIPKGTPYNYWRVFNSSDINMGGISAIHFCDAPSGPDSTITNNVLTSNGKVVIALSFSYAGGHDSMIQETFEKILSTFKFTQ